MSLAKRKKSEWRFFVNDLRESPTRVTSTGVDKSGPINNLYGRCRVSVYLYGFTWILRPEALKSCMVQVVVIACVGSWSLVQFVITSGIEAGSYRSLQRSRFITKLEVLFASRW